MRAADTVSATSSSGLLLLISLILAVAVLTSAEVTYRGAQVIRLPTRRIVESGELLQIQGVDIWAQTANFTDMMVTKRRMKKLKDILRRYRIPYDIMIKNVQTMIDKEKQEVFRDEGYYAKKRNGISFNTYNRLKDIHDYLEYLADKYADIVTVGSMGYSHEQRPLKYIKISSSKPDAKAFFLDGGIHAREWISPAVVVYVIRELVENRKRMPKELLDMDFFILPVLNPDGYEYSHTTNRLWRKNRSEKIDGCRGVDLNRNFGYKWGGKGTSGASCSEVYRGKGPFSEPESRAVADFISAFQHDIEVYLSLHSYSQLILLPYAYDRVYPSDFDKLKTVGNDAADAIFTSGGKLYEVGNSVDILYAAAGGSYDWAKAVAGVKYSYIFELRDTGQYGFLLPANQIIPTGRETLEAIKVIAAAATS